MTKEGLAWLIFAEGLSSTTWVGFAVNLTGIYLAQSSSSAIHDIDADT